MTEIKIKVEYNEKTRNIETQMLNCKGWDEAMAVAKIAINRVAKDIGLSEAEVCRRLRPIGEDINRCPKCLKVTLVDAESSNPSCSNPECDWSD